MGFAPPLFIQGIVVVRRDTALKSVAQLLRPKQIPKTIVPAKCRLAGDTQQAPEYGLLLQARYLKIFFYR